MSFSLNHLAEPLGGVADEVGGKLDLLVGLVVHEVVGAAVVVEILHLLGDELHVLKLGAGVAGLVDHAAGLEVTDLVADKGTALAGLDVLELNDRVVLVVDLEAHAVLEVCSADGCHVAPFWSYSHTVGYFSTRGARASRLRADSMMARRTRGREAPGLRDVGRLRTPTR